MPEARAYDMTTTSTAWYVNGGQSFGVAATLFLTEQRTMSDQQGGDAMAEYLLLLLQKVLDAFLITLANKLAERLASPKDPKTRKRPSPPRRDKQKG